MDSVYIAIAADKNTLSEVSPTMAEFSFRRGGIDGFVGVLLLYQGGVPFHQGGIGGFIGD